MGSQQKLRVRKIGDRQVYPVGLGAMLFTMPDPPPGVSEEPIPEAQAIRTMHAALDVGVRVFDTAINYVMAPELMGRNEALVAKALASWSGDKNDVLVVAKGGNKRTAEAAAAQDGSRENLRWSCETTLKALGVGQLALYVLHAPDPNVPFEDVIGTLVELKKEGKIGMIGLSNVGRSQYAKAAAITEISAIEHQLSPGFRATLPLANTCKEDGVAFLAYRPVGGQQASPSYGETHPALGRIAAERGVSPQRVAIAWGLAQGNNIIPIPSARRPETILDSAQAATLELTAEELALIDEPVAQPG